MMKLVLAELCSCETRSEGTRVDRSWTSRICDCSIWARLVTLTEIGVSCRVAGRFEAVTTIRSLPVTSSSMASGVATPGWFAGGALTGGLTMSCAAAALARPSAGTAMEASSAARRAVVVETIRMKETFPRQWSETGRAAFWTQSVVVRRGGITAEEKR
jgi:hypothetical protein